MRWLRPDYQQASDADRLRPAATVTSGQQLTLRWPKDLPHQVAAVRDWLATVESPVSAHDVADSHSGASSGAVIPALETLVALGVAAGFDSERGRCWKGLARTSDERTSNPGIGKVSSRPPPPASMPASG